MKNILKKLNYNDLIYAGILFLMSYLLLYCDGMPKNNTIFNSLCLFLILISLTYNKFTFWLLFTPLVLIWGAYSPVALTNGAPTYQHIISLLATNTQEGYEFFSTIPVYNYIPALVIFSLFGICAHQRCYSRVVYFKQAYFLILATVILAVSSPSLALFQQTWKAYKDVVRDTDRLYKLTRTVSWGGVRVDPKYDDYVLVIGESARKDYHHAYGYPIENTPFMSTSKGVLIDGFTSGGSYTIGSLRLMLTLPDKTKWAPNYDLNIIDLANLAGFSTYWFSNNSFNGSGAFPITAIGLKSKEYYFLNPPGQSDFSLLKHLERALEDKSKSPRLIVLDIYGSHPNFCKRVEDYPLIVKPENSSSTYLNCYATSIAKTDEFLKRVYQKLENNYLQSKRTYSMIYFADHGFCSSGERFLSSGKCINMSQYAVPLFKLSSDDQTRQKISVFKSGLNFTEGLANWLGIQNSQIAQYDLFSPIPDSSDYGLVEKILKGNPHPDPFIDYRINK